MNERDIGVGAPDAGMDTMWLVRAVRWVATRWRPHLGWLVLALCLLLVMLPALLVWENRWLRAPELIARLYLAGPLAIVLLWLTLGWRRPYQGGPTIFRVVIQSLLLVAGTGLLTSQLLVGWWPGWAMLIEAARTGAWSVAAEHMAMAFAQVGIRYTLWWQGVQSDRAGRDDLIVFGFALAVVWLLSMATGALVRRYRQGFLGATPVLWIVGLVMLYSVADRWLMVGGVALAVLLHLTLDQQALQQRWQTLQLDYNPLALLERAFVALGILAIALALAALAPNLYWIEITGRYYALIAPVNERIEALSARAFPALTGVNPWALGGGAAGGLPNDFLLRAGPAASERTVMHVRTSETPRTYDTPPLAHHLRGATYSIYDGRGWQNPAILLQTTHGADQPWTTVPETGRRTLLQSVNLSFSGRVLYAVGEPATPSIGYRAQERFPGDLVMLTADARSYTIASQIPALSTAELEALPAWDEVTPLPAPYANYLALPDSVTPRTRALAAELTAGATTLYGRAAAIERYLRTFPYDLSVPALPETVTDVADYFLFDLQRGYCDYYATAFVVLARAVGIPARFVTGFTAGAWLPTEQLWEVTEAHAHSWPEVYFPEVGWIPFEPTGGQPELVRFGVTRNAGAAPLTTPTLDPLPESLPFDDRWLWLAVPVLLLMIGSLIAIQRYRRRREDPWGALRQWGSRAGRAHAPGETAIEYGRALASHISEMRQDEAEARRIASRELLQLSEEFSALHYAPTARRTGLRAQINARWQRLRSYLQRLKQ